MSQNDRTCFVYGLKWCPCFDGADAPVEMGGVFVLLPHLCRGAGEQLRTAGGFRHERDGAVCLDAAKQCGCLAAKAEYIGVVYCAVLTEFFDGFRFDFEDQVQQRALYAGLCDLLCFQCSDYLFVAAADQFAAKAADAG